MIFTRVRGFAHRIPRVTTIPNLSAIRFRISPVSVSGCNYPVHCCSVRAQSTRTCFAVRSGAWLAKPRARRPRARVPSPTCTPRRTSRPRPPDSTASRNSIASSTRVSPLLPRGEVRRCVLDRATVPRLANRRADQLRATLGHASSVSRETFARRASRDAASSARPRAFFRARRDSTGRTVVSSPSPRATEPRADARSTLVPQATPPTSPPPPARTAAPSPRR